MTKKELIEQIKLKKSFLCIGLDVDLNKIPKHLLKTEDPIFEFNKQIIDNTYHLAVAYKPNIAFYEYYGHKGWQSLEKTIHYINKKYPEIFTIADAKRGDIGNTSAIYAKAFFENLNFDAVTVNPYMGIDSIEPFLAFKNKFTILLALTSNKGSLDFQIQKTYKNTELYQEILRKSTNWCNSEQLMYVVGANKADHLKKIREIVKDHFLLIPGIGVQGGKLLEVCKYGFNDDIGLLVNSSREIIYANNKKEFAEATRQKALELQKEMKILLEKRFFENIKVTK